MEAWVVIFWIICGIGAAVIAENKNRSSCGWGIAGFVFGPLMLLVIGFISPLEDQVQMKKCPYCAERIQIDAIICRYCNSTIPSRRAALLSSNLPDSKESNHSDDLDERDAFAVPRCSQCGVEMSIKRAKNGNRAGELFYVCPNFRTCGQVFPVNLDDDRFIV